MFKLSLVRYLNPADHNPRRTTKSGKGFEKKLDFKGKTSSQNQRRSQN